jgi:hypothetical protein
VEAKARERERQGEGRKYKEKAKKENALKSVKSPHLPNDIATIRIYHFLSASSLSLSLSLFLSMPLFA